MQHKRSKNREAGCCEVALVWKQDFGFPSFSVGPMKLLPRLVVDAFESYCLTRRCKPEEVFTCRSGLYGETNLAESSALATLAAGESRLTEVVGHLAPGEDGLRPELRNQRARSNFACEEMWRDVLKKTAQEEGVVSSQSSGEPVWTWGAFIREPFEGWIPLRSPSGQVILSTEAGWWRAWGIWSWFMLIDDRHW